MRLGVIGAGEWGINHVRVLASEVTCDELVVAEPDRRRIAQIHTVAPRARHVESVDDLVDAVDAVIIASPAATHVDLSLRMLRARKHVLIEKPFALSLLDAHAVSEAARIAGTIAMVGHLMVFHPAVRRLRELARSGSLGRPYFVQATRVNLGRLRADETALWCFGPHDLSIFDYVLGEHPIEVAAGGQAVLQPGIEDVAFMTLRYASGLVANVLLSWLHPRRERRVTLVCSERMVEFDDVAIDKLKIYDKGYDRPPAFQQFSEFLTIRDGDVHVPHVPMVEPLCAQLQHFLACIGNRREPETGLASATRVTAVLDAAERSLRRGGAPQSVEQS